MGRHLARPAFPARIAGLLALALVGITCRDRDPMGPGLPSQGTLPIAPRMERSAAEGGPSFVSLSRVRGILTPVGGGSSYTVDASFVGDTATLAFDVTFPGPTQRYTLELAAIDTAGDTLFRSMREVTASPGNNAPVHDTLRYVAPDTAVASILLAAGDSLIVGTDTLLVSATGIDRADKPVSKLYIGWSSSDTAVARVVSSGPSSARIIGRDVDAVAWIVGRAFNGVADSLAVRVSVAVGSVAISADTIRTVAGGSALATATVLNRSGASIDRPIVWSSLDTTIAVVRPALATDGQSAVPGQIAVAGLRAGTTRVVAQSDSKSDTSVVVVAPAPVAVVQIVPDSIALLVGDSARFGVVLLGANGDTLSGRTVSWTSGDTKLATIDATSGTVRAVAPGTVAVVASAEGVVDSAWVRVALQPTAIVRTVVSPKSVRFLALGESAQLVAQSYAADSSLTPGRYTWAIHGGAGVIGVDSLGRVAALATGSAWVVATEAGGTADSAQVSVEQLVQTVLLSPALVRGVVGDTVRFTATAVDARGNAIALGSPSWRNLENFVTSLDASGGALLAEPGLDTVSVTIGGLTARAEVSVQSAASALTISGRTSFDALRDTTVLHATALDRFQKAIPNPSIEWSVQNPSVAAVVATGGDSAVVVSLGNGDGGIVARLGTASAAARVSVTQKPAALLLAPGTVTLGPGGRSMLAAQLVDARGVAVAPGGEQPVWSLAGATDSAIVQVDGSGAVLATGSAGTATVVADLGGMKGTAKVVVTDAVAKTIAFGRDTILLGLDTVKVPVLLSAPAGGAGLVVTLSALGAEAGWVGTNQVAFGPTETLQYAQLAGRAAGAVTLVAEDSSRVFAGDSASGIVRSGARLASWSLDWIDTLRVNATDDVPLRALMDGAAPAGGAPVSMLVEAAPGVATVSPSPATIPAGQLSADVMLHAGAPGTARLTPQTRGLPGAAATIVVDTAILTLRVDTTRGGCDGPCEARARTAAPRQAYNAPRISTGSAAVLSQQRAARKATATYYPYPNGGDAGHVVLGAGQYLPTARAYGSCYFADCGAVLSIPHPTFAGIRAALSADDPTVARAEEGAAVPAPYDATYLSISGLAAGTTTVRARAADWREGSLLVTVTTPRLVAVSEGTVTLPGRLEGDSVDVLVADSLHVAHPRLSSLAVHAYSSAPEIVGVRDSLVVVAAGDAHTAVFLVPRAAGKAWIHVRAGGHLEDSVQVTVQAPTLYPNPAQLAIGAGQQRAGEISIELLEPATHSVSIVARSLDPSIATLRDTLFSIVPGWTYPRSGVSSPTIVGVKEGTARVVIEADSGFAPETLSVAVTAPHVGVVGGAATAGQPATIYVYTADSAGNWAASTDPNGLDAIHVTSADSSVLALDTTITMPAGSQYTYLSVTARGSGTTTLRVARAGWIGDSSTLVVEGPVLSAGLSGCSYTQYYYCPSDRIGVGQKSGGADLRASLGAPAAKDVVVRFAGAKHVQLPDSVVIAQGATDALFGFSGLAAGVDSIQVSAAGYADAWMTLGATPTTIQPLFDGKDYWMPDTVAVDSTTTLQLQVRDQYGQSRPSAADMKFVVTASNPDVVQLDSAALTLPVDGTNTGAATIRFLKPGTTTITIADAAGTIPAVTTRSITVTGPRLRASVNGNPSVGTRQATEVIVWLPRAAEGQTVTLVSTNPRVAAPVTQTATVSAYPYDSVHFAVESFDTTGTVQLVATADGYDRAAARLVVTRPRLFLDFPWDVSPLSPAATPSVSVGDEFGYTHPTTVPLTIDVVSAHPEVIAPAQVQVQIPAGSWGEMGDSAMRFLRTGTTTLTARDERGGAGGYAALTDTVTVRHPTLYSYDGDARLAPGQYHTGTAYLEQASTTGMMAHFAMRPGSAIAPLMDQTLEAGAWEVTYDLVAKAAGMDTVVVSVDGYDPLRVIARVGTGRIAFDQLPTEIVAGDSVAVVLSALSPDGYTYAQIDSAAFAIAVAGTGVVVTDGSAPLSAVTIPGGSSSAPTVWLKATGAPGEVADVVFSRAGYGSYRARITVTSQPLGVARMTLTR